MKKNVAFVPVKLNNERLPGKNTKLLGGKPLIGYILETLCQVEGLDDIYVYCSNEAIIEYLPEKVHFLKRDVSLDRSDTPILEVLRRFAEDVPAERYVLAHATAPFIKKETIEKGLARVSSGENDSALSVVKCADFLWKDGAPLNYDPRAIPRTQDLSSIYIETTGLYIYGRDLILERSRRTGDTPYLIEVSEEEAVDINVPLDFALAEAVYENKKERREL